jgi:hypothetical protein
MRFDGRWRLCEDGLVRPVLSGEVLASDVNWVSASFLVDCGADRTVFNLPVLKALNIAATAVGVPLEGVGGLTAAVVVQTQMRFQRETGEAVVFKGKFAAITDPHSLDMSVLGRDITNLFALIVDRPQDVVALLGKGHRYHITAP